MVSVAEVAPRHVLLRLHAPQLAQTAAPGQFVHALPQLSGDSEDALSFDPLLRRAFSIMNVEGDGNALDSIKVLFRAEGRGTKMLAGARVSDEIDLIGPLGRPFDTSMFHVKQSNILAVTNSTRAIVVGGGVGVPPLVFLSYDLKRLNVEVKALIGARSRLEIIGQDELEAAGACVEIATDDGSVGHRGRVTELLQRDLEQANGAIEIIVYACGPWPMLRTVAQLCERMGVRAQVSMEEAMPCGIGVCNGCVVRARQPLAASPAPVSPHEIAGDEWSPYQIYRRICVEGPACWAHEIEWDAPPQHQVEAQLEANCGTA